MILVAFASLVLNLGLAQAQDVSTSAEKPIASFRILGKGVMARDSHRWMGLACVAADSTAPCAEVRFMVASQDGSYEFVGNTYALDLNAESHEPKAEAVNALKGKLRQQIKDQMETQKLKRPGSHLILVDGLVASAGFGLLGAGIVAGPALVVTALGSALYLAIRPVAGLGLNVFTNSANNVDNRDGWNWSNHPDQISEKKFDLYLKTLSATL